MTKLYESEFYKTKFRRQKDKNTNHTGIVAEIIVAGDWSARSAPTNGRLPGEGGGLNYLIIARIDNVHMGSGRGPYHGMAIHIIHSLAQR